jgi:DNA-binding CsgD family transcriptional regulator/DNA-binding transcriptional ArsR family regulator
MQRNLLESNPTSDGPIEVLRDLLARGLHSQVIQEGRELCGVLTEPSDLATLQVLIGRAEMFNGRLGPAVQRFRLAEFGDLNPGDRLRLGISEAMVRFGSGGVSAVIEVIDELEANANDDNLTLAATAGLRAWTSIEQSNTTRAVELAKISNERALRHDDHDLIVLSWLILGLSTTAVGEIESGAKALATGIEHSTSSNHVAALPVLHLVAADTDHLRGRLAHAQYHARLSVESSEPISSGAVGVGANGLLATIADRCGDQVGAASYVIDAERALLRGAPLGWGNLALARLRLDRSIDPEQAAQRLLDVWRYLQDQGSVGYASIFSIPVAELSNRLAQPPTMREIVSRLKAIRPASSQDGLARDLALAVIDEDLTTAVGIVRLLDQSRTTHLCLVGDAFSLVANLLERKTDKRARTFADEARAIYSEMQAHGDLQRLLSRHPTIAGANDLVLSAAEKRVVALVIDGCSNAQIAQELFLSIKTVEAHLARIYRRFGVKSRMQLVRFCEANPTGM